MRRRSGIEGVSGMSEPKPKRKSIGEHFTYAYLRHIKKWMFCPNCASGKLAFNKKASKWQCENCGYELSADEFEDDYVFWFCDECGAYLNNQEGFDRKAKKWVCTSCGYENETTMDNLKGVCVDCGKIIPDPEGTLCVDCRLIRRERSKERLKNIGTAVGIGAAAVGIGIAAAYSQSDNVSEPLPPPPEDDREYPTCDLCGEMMTEFDGWAWYTCPNCGNTVRIFEDGTTTWERELFGPGAGHPSQTCEYCGASLAGGKPSLPWENGSNRNGYVICPHCGRANFEDDD